MKTFKQFQEARLTADQRRALPNKDFALPGKGEGPKGKQAGSYPIPDEKHARSALSMVSQHGTPEEKATVRAKVKKKFPGIQQEDKAFDYVKNKLKAKYGDGVLTTGEKMKPPTAAQKKAAAAHREKIAKQQAAEFKKDPSQGRYPPQYSNRGSD